MGCGVWSLEWGEFGACSVESGVWGGERGVWMWSAKWTVVKGGVWSVVECGVLWSVECVG